VTLTVAVWLRARIDFPPAQFSIFRPQNPLKLQKRNPDEQ
jgi:hypothetical protein